jgi:hypothetical protein
MYGIVNLKYPIRMLLGFPMASNCKKKKRRGGKTMELTIFRPGIQPSDRKLSYFEYRGSDARPGEHSDTQFQANSPKPSGMEWGRGGEEHIKGLHTP